MKRGSQRPTEPCCPGLDGLLSPRLTLLLFAAVDGKFYKAELSFTTKPSGRRPEQRRRGKGSGRRRFQSLWRPCHWQGSDQLEHNTPLPSHKDRRWSSWDKSVLRSQLGEFNVCRPQNRTKAETDNKSGIKAGFTHNYKLQREIKGGWPNLTAGWAGFTIAWFKQAAKGRVTGFLPSHGCRLSSCKQMQP